MSALDNCYVFIENLNCIAGNVICFETLIRSEKIPEKY